MSAQEVQTCGPILAVLAVIGGIDLRPRLGGLVQHDEFGVGTIASVKKKQVKVLFEDHRTPKLCPVAQLKPVRFGAARWTIHGSINGSTFALPLLWVLWCNG